MTTSNPALFSLFGKNATRNKLSYTRGNILKMLTLQFLNFGTYNSAYPDLYEQRHTVSKARNVSNSDI